jgi:hypothetical protein
MLCPKLQYCAALRLWVVLCALDLLPLWLLSAQQSCLVTAGAGAAPLH